MKHLKEHLAKLKLNTAAKKLKLNEDLNIEGAVLIGESEQRRHDTTATYRIYRIDTYEAANKFIVDDNPNVLAGDFHIGNAERFEAVAPGHSQILYYITEYPASNENNVVYVVVKGNRMHDFTYNDDELTFKTNVQVSLGGSTNVNNLCSDYSVPLGLIPDVKFGDLPNDYGLIVEENTLLLIDANFSKYSSVDTLRLPSEIHKINKRAASIFYQITHINTLIIPETVTEVEGNAITSFSIQNIFCTAEIKPFLYSDYAFASRIHVKWNMGLSNEEKAEREATQAGRLIYREDKNEITIFGVKKNLSADLQDLIIPEKINDKPVTKIAPYAFFEFGGNLNRIILPKTIKEIGKCAFYNSAEIEGPFALNTIQTGKDSFKFTDYIRINEN